MPQTITTKDGTVLDAGVVNLAKAIRARESKGDYNAIGDAGTSKGAYQWQPNNFENGARKYGLNPSDFSPINQDKVAYYQVKELKEKGYTPEQVAASWNAGEGSLKNDAWRTMRGSRMINGQKVDYDVPAYVQSVTSEFQKLKGGYVAKPYSSGVIDFSKVHQPTEEKDPATDQPISIIPNIGEIGADLNQNLKGRGTDFQRGIETAARGGTNFLGNLAMGAIQTVGAVAGGAGDLVNAGLQFIPGVQAAEKGIENLAEKALNTSTGKDVSAALGDFANKNPDIAKTIGGGVNVLAAIPILRGLTAVKDAVANTGVAAFRGRIEESAKKEIEESLTKVPGRSVARANARGIDPVDYMITNSALPEVVPNPSGGFMYSSKKAIDDLSKQLDGDELLLQEMLTTAIKKNTMVSLDDARKQVLKDIRLNFPLSGNFTPAVRAVDDYFDSVGASSGGRNWISLNELNDIKRDVRGAVFNVAGDIKGTASAEIKYSIGQSVMKQIEEVAAKAGAKDVRKLNQEMAKKIEAIKVLEAMDGKNLKVKRGLMKEAAVGGASIAAEGGAAAIGLPPVAAALAGRSLGGKILGRVPRTPVGKLGRFRNPKSSLTKGVLDLTKGLGVQSISRQPSTE